MPDVLHPWLQASWQRLQTVCQAGRLPHAMLITGQVGVGKSALTHAFAQSLLCQQTNREGFACGDCKPCHLFTSGNHPDVRWITTEEGDKTIKVKAIRQLIHRSALSTSGKMAVFVITPAEVMNHAAANALLKTLEEPNDRQIILLISSRPDWLPATIKSRCQHLSIVASKQETVSWFKENTDSDHRQKLIALYAESPLLALNVESLEQSEDLFNEMSAVAFGQKSPIKAAQALTDSLADRPIESQLTHLTHWVLDLVRMRADPDSPSLRHQWRKQELQKLVEGIDLKQWLGYLDHVFDVQRKLPHYPNPQLAYEHLLIQWHLLATNR